MMAQCFLISAVRNSTRYTPVFQLREAEFSEKALPSVLPIFILSLFFILGIIELVACSLFQGTIHYLTPGIVLTTGHQGQLPGVPG